MLTCDYCQKEFSMAYGPASSSRTFPESAKFLFMCTCRAQTHACTECLQSQREEGSEPAFKVLDFGLVGRGSKERRLHYAEKCHRCAK